ncbi:MAG TPA: hypothetical protein VFH17_00920 [Coriobacteriia bacterium]|nr:hypothetical protein [Coriobacteriia bacterium]
MSSPRTEPDVEHDARPGEREADASAPAPPLPPPPAPAGAGDSALKTAVLLVAALAAVVATFLVLQAFLAALGLGGG